MGRAMPLYTFYPCRADGTSTTFEVYDLVDDDAALARAKRVAQDHLSCDSVAVWCGSRRVRPEARGESLPTDGTRPSA